jgi:hypothetical protein
LLNRERRAASVAMGDADADVGEKSGREMGLWFSAAARWYLRMAAGSVTDTATARALDPDGLVITSLFVLDDDLRPGHHQCPIGHGDGGQALHSP